MFQFSIKPHFHDAKVILFFRFCKKKVKNLHFVLFSEQKEGGEDGRVETRNTHQGTEMVAAGPDGRGWRAEKYWGIG